MVVHDVDMQPVRVVGDRALLRSALTNLLANAWKFTGKRPDPRSFCIQKTLQTIGHTGDDPDAIEHNLMFSGHNAFRFARDPFYSNGFIPTVRQLVERILTGR